MNIFREIPPTAGFPLCWKDFLALLRIKNRANSLENDFRQYLNVDYARITNSGTSAFYLILESLKKISGKKTVIIPSYICPLIPLAIKRAGLQVEICDINKDNFNFYTPELEGLCRNNNDILAIVAVHLGGIPAAFDAIKTIAGKYNIFTIEDCAQSLGARYKDRLAGTLGDFSFFSLCRGKGLTTYEGGVIVSNKREYIPFIDDTIQRLVKKDPAAESLLVALLFGYWVFYRPLLFWFVFRLPQIFWNWRGEKLKAAMEDFDMDFPVHKMSSARQLIGHSQFGRLEKEIAKQRHKASFYMSRLEKIKGITLIKELPDTSSTYPFISVIFDDPGKKEKALKTFNALEYGVSIVYASAISDYNYLKHIVPDRNCSNARYLSARTITLSTNTFLRDEDMDITINILENL